MHDAVGLTEMTSAGAAGVTAFTSVGDVTFASDLLPEILLSQDTVLSSYWLLDSGADFHVTPHREWFSTYSSERLGSMRLADDSACDIVGAGDVQLSLPSGVSLLLHHVRHVPDLCVSLISIDQLRDSGCQILLTEQQFRMHQGSLVIARGARLGNYYPMRVEHAVDGIVSVSMQPCRETRRVSFADRLQDALPVLAQSSDYVVHDISVDTEPEDPDALFFDAFDSFEVERLCSSETQHDPSSDTMTEMVCIGADLSVMHTCLGADLSVMQPFIPGPVVQTVVQQGQLSLCDEVTTVVGDLDLDEPVIESFTYMLMPVEADAVLELVCASDTEDSGLADTLGVHAMCEEHSGLIEFETVVCHVDPPEVEDCREWFPESDLTEVVSLVEIATVASAFGILMCDLLVSRPDLAAAVGAFAVRVVSHTEADSGIEQGRAMQVITRYLQEVHEGSSTSGVQDAFLLEHIQTHAHVWSELVGVG